MCYLNCEDVVKLPLIQPLRGRHGRLDGQAPHVLPALLQQRDEIVDGQHDVTNQLILRHVHISHCHTQTQHLLQLEFDGRFNLGDLARQIFIVGDGRGEFSRCFLHVFSVAYNIHLLV